MGLTRAECANMGSVTLQISIDGRATRLRRAWMEGRPGSVTDIYDLALLHAESVLRAHNVDGPLHDGQLRLFDVGGV
jgi:hypothetical protein